VDPAIHWCLLLLVQCLHGVGTNTVSAVGQLLLWTFCSLKRCLHIKVLKLWLWVQAGGTVLCATQTTKTVTPEMDEVSVGHVYGLRHANHYHHHCKRVAGDQTSGGFDCVVACRIPGRIKPACSAIQGYQAI
jgi:hypothetical protein